MPIHRHIQSTVDSIEPEEDRLSIKLLDIPGSFWVATVHEELVTTLRRALQTGIILELTVVTHSGEIADARPEA